MADGGEVAVVGDAAAVPAGDPANPEQPQQQQQPSILRTILTQLFIMYLINSFFRSGKNTSTGGPGGGVGNNLFHINESMVSSLISLNYIILSLRLSSIASCMHGLSMLSNFIIKKRIIVVL